jgi:hypothetical protein
MGGLKLFGMQAADDEIVATAVKRQHEPHRIIGDLLAAELSEKQARSMKYRLTVARLPFAKEIDEFAFTDTPVNETLVRELAASPTAPRRPRPRPPTSPTGVPFASRSGVPIPCRLTGVSCCTIAPASRSARISARS